MPETERDLATMTWEDAGDALLSADAVVVPTGSTEQHSVHLPLSTDSLRAEHLSAELVGAAPDHGLDLLRAPTLPYGDSEHHMPFPGTVTLSQDTYKQALIDVGSSLAEHGAKRVLFLNCHGGNKQALSLATDRLNRDHEIGAHFVHWTDFGRDELEDHFGDGWGHAGDHETSFVELVRDDLVKSDRKEPQEADEMPGTRSYTYFSEVTELGGLGDPTNSDPEFMAEVVDNTTERILEALAEDIENGW
ncbi:creatininase family protein [Halobaculum sp. CBA1158]|uniref:creatininase family protein n=1 Tax=Halobaculum sp. CBA1158 TaxID=2904243 RepID=UPI001F1C693B|nr:creatininase family protein [Halobaculum sp. CBA1158]UIP00417.1 creatininase family protein [Halobaculum sp. CBA1158]